MLHSDIICHNQNEPTEDAGTLGVTSLGPAFVGDDYRKSRRRNLIKVKAQALLRQ